MKINKEEEMKKPTYSEGQNEKDTTWKINVNKNKFSSTLEFFFHFFLKNKNNIYCWIVLKIGAIIIFINKYLFIQFFCYQILWI